MPDVPTITAAELDGLSADGWIVLDVRTDAEWVEGRIDGSVHIPLDQLIARIDEIGDKVVCVCAVGGRSAQATVYLNSIGKQAVNLAGGVNDWVQRARPLVKG